MEGMLVERNEIQKILTIRKKNDLLRQIWEIVWCNKKKRKKTNKGYFSKSKKFKIRKKALEEKQICFNNELLMKA